MRPAASDRRSRYLEAALHAELGDVASAQPGTRNDTLNRAAFRLAQLTASGQGDIRELPELLLQAAVTAGLAEAEARATIHSGLETGHQQPRPTPVARAELGAPRHYNQNHRRPPSRPPSPGATAGLMLGVIGAIDSRHDQLVALVEEA